MLSETFLTSLGTEARADLARLRAIAAPLALGLALFVISLPLLMIGRELAIGAAARLLDDLAGWELARTLARAAPLDPIYSAAALEMLGNIKSSGVAVVDPVGSLLHTVIPGVFASPRLANGSLASIVIWSGSSVFARGLAQFLGNTAVLVFSMLAVRVALGTRSRLWSVLNTKDRGALLAFGLFTAIAVAAEIVSDPPEASDLEAMGLSFAVGVLFPSWTGRRLAISDVQSALPGQLLGLCAVLVTLLASLFVAWVIVRGLDLIRLELAARGVAWRCRVPFWRNVPVPFTRWVWSLGIGAAALVLAAALVAAEPEPVAMVSGHEGLVTNALAETAAAQPPSEAAVEPVKPIRLRPSVVLIDGKAYDFSYAVDGQRQVIRGMGYNPIYKELPASERAGRYDRDFALMKKTGVNTVFGWTTEEFDGLLLDKAYEHGLGVAMPYHLSPEVDYEKAEITEVLKRDVLNWAEGYRGHPGLRMWAIGNEVLHKMVYPSWLPMRKNSQQAMAQAKAFARFYVDAIDQVHAVDPDHPIVLRDAEDAYLGWIREALQAKPASRPWFIYGINIYTSRLGDVVEGWPKHNLGTPLLISEFAPSGLSTRDRPEGYRKMWSVLRRRQNWTLGGVPYVWTTAGPEEIDRAFGLVDANGKPVDGSLQAISDLYAASRNPDAGTP